MTLTKEQIRDRSWKRSPEMVFRRFGEELVLVPIRKGIGDFESFYVLNELGYEIWNRLETTQGVEQLCQSLLGEYDVDSNDLEEDIVEFLYGLSDLQAILPEDKEIA